MSNLPGVTGPLLYGHATYSTGAEEEELLLTVTKVLVILIFLKGAMG